MFVCGFGIVVCGRDYTISSIIRSLIDCGSLIDGKGAQGYSFIQLIEDLSKI